MEATPRFDQEIMDGFKKGDHLAFRAVFDRYYRPLCFFAFNLIRDIDVAEDLVADTMRKLWERHTNFESIMNVQAFLYLTLRNACLNLLKSEQYRAKQREQLLQSLQRENENVRAAQVIKTELLEKIQREVESLPEKQKTVFKLFYFEELTIDEIAQKLQLTPSTVANHKFLALKKLQKIFFGKNDLATALYILAILCCH